QEAASTVDGERAQIGVSQEARIGQAQGASDGGERDFDCQPREPVGEKTPHVHRVAPEGAPCIRARWEERLRYARSRAASRSWMSSRPTGRPRSSTTGS